MSLNGDNSRDQISSNGILFAEEAKEAVLTIIEKLENNLQTHKLLLHILRSLDNPLILEREVNYLDSIEDENRKRIELMSKIKTVVLTIIGLVFTTFVTWLWRFLPMGSV